MASKSISKSVVWQLLGKFLLQGIAFFTAPIFTRLLTPADYGYVALYTSWCSIVTLFIGLEVGGSINNARMKIEEENFYSYLSSIFSISFISFFFFLIVSVIFKNPLSKILQLREDLIILLVLQGFATFTINFFIFKLDAFKQVERSALLSLFQSLIIIVLSLLFVYRYDNKGIAKIYGNAVPTMLIGIFITIFIYVKGKCFWKTEYNIFCVTLTLPLLGHSLGNLIYTQSDRIMIQRMISEEELGIYSISYTLCSIIMIIYMALNNAWVPFYYDFKKQDNELEILSHSKRYLKLFTIICIGFLLLSDDVYKLMTPNDYWSGIKIIPILVVSLYFGFLYLFPANFEFYNSQTKMIPVGTLLSAIINVIANYILIPKFGIMGAAIGTLLSHIALFLFHEIIAVYIMKQEFEYKFKFYLTNMIVFFISTFIIYLIKDLFILRWIISIILGCYLCMDIYKKRSIF